MEEAVCGHGAGSAGAASFGVCDRLMLMGKARALWGHVKSWVPLPPSGSQPSRFRHRAGAAVPRPRRAPASVKWVLGLARGCRARVALCPAGPCVRHQPRWLVNATGLCWQRGSWQGVGVVAAGGHGGGPVAGGQGRSGRSCSPSGSAGLAALCHDFPLVSEQRSLAACATRGENDTSVDRITRLPAPGSSLPAAW